MTAQLKLWLEDYFGPATLEDSTDDPTVFPKRPILKFAGNMVTVQDDPINGRSIVTVHGPFDLPGPSLAGLRWQLPIVGGACPFATAVTALMGGDPDVIYNVTLHFRGVAETNTFVGGTTVGYFTTGGAVSQTISANRNVYRLLVADPAQTYYLNTSQGVGDQGNISVALDYQVTVQMRGGSSVTLLAESFDGLEAANTPGVILPGDSVAYVGQAIQMDVVLVA